MANQPNGDVPIANRRNNAPLGAPVENVFDDDPVLAIQGDGLGGGLGAAHQALLHRDAPTGKTLLKIKTFLNLLNFFV